MSYRKTVFTALKEILLNERPELDMEIPDISAYDRILIGSPIWCGTFPNAVFSFLDKVNLNGKKQQFLQPAELQNHRMLQ